MMQMKRQAWPIVVMIALGGWTPASAQDRVHQQMMAEIRMLQEQQQQLRQLMGGLAETLRALNAKIEDQNNATRKAFADQRLIVDTVAEGVRILREKADDTSVRLSTLAQELEALRQTIAAVQVRAAADPADPATGGGVTAPGGTALPVGVSVQRQYDVSYGDYVVGQYDLAISGFEEFIRQYPGSALADDAQLNIGVSYLNSGRYEQAVAALQQVIGDYPESDNLPSAYFKLGEAYQRLNQPDAARKAWETVIERFPNANESQLARQALERLKRR